MVENSRVRDRSSSVALLIATAADVSWSLAPGPLLLCAVLTATYVIRWRRVRSALGSGKHGAPVKRLVAWLFGVACIAVALLSPVDTLAEQVFGIHMVQHILLLDIAPILLIAGLTKVLLRPVARPVLALERSLGPLAHPAFAIAFYAGVMWAWHIPLLYDAALEYPVVHVLQHTLVFSAGLLYWWHLLSPVRSRRFSGLGPVVYMSATKVLVGVLGILLTFAPNALYEFYENAPSVWGLSPGDDQKLAGSIMALEQTIVMGVALTYLFIRALSESEREEQRADRYDQELAN